MGPDGNYFLACDKTDAVAGSIWKYREGTGWENITPQGTGGGNESYWDVAVDPTNGQRVVAMANGGKAFVSTDAGEKWEAKGFRLSSDGVTWMNQQEQNYFLSVGELKFDPFEPGKLWFAEGLGMWWATDFSQPAIEWHEASRGIEECSTNELVAPPGGKPVGVVWDDSGFYFNDPDAYTAERAWPFFMAGWSVDWCPADPKFLAAVFQNNLNFGEHPKASGYSTDGGRTWQRFAAIEDKTLPTDLAYGQIALAADTPKNLVWCPAEGKLPCYTTDGGTTWKPSDCGNLKETGLVAYYKGQRPLCADRVAPGTFYLYTFTDGFYRSTDGGASFRKVSELPGGFASAKLKATPGRAGELWLAEGAGGRLRHSKDGGKTWSVMEGLQHGMNVGLGKAVANGSYPTLFVAGVVEGAFGFYRSTDEGASWDKIGGYPLGIFEWVTCLDGDKDVFGKVYLGFAQAGFAYGQVKGK